MFLGSLLNMQLCYLFIICFAIIAGQDSVVADTTKNHAKIAQAKTLGVQRGSNAVITTNNLEIFANGSIVCRIEVVYDPICLRFGKLSANKFSCDLSSESVHYLHSGSLTSDEDCIKLKLLLFYKNRTEKETVKVKVVVKNLVPNENLTKPLLIVNQIGGMKSFGSEILPINAKKYQTSCKISIFAGEKWPANGKVSAITNMTSWKCLDFKATYLHDGSYIPNEDFIPLKIRWRDTSEGDKETRYHLRVRIQGAQANEQPSIYSRRSRLIVKQYSVTQIQTFHVRAYDYKTAPTDLILKVSTLTQNFDGHFGSIENPSEPLEGITQEMIENGKVLFIAPKNSAVKKRRMFSLQQFKVQAIDPYGGISKRTLRLLFFVRKFVAHYLSVVKNQPMHVLEGNSCVLSEKILEVACPGTNCNAAVFSVIEEPKHGGIFEDWKKVNRFTFDDLTSGRINYKHDNSENLIDNIIISVTHRSQLAFATINVVVEPIDDSPPFLSVHKDILAKSGRFSKIESAVLQASDPDSDVTMIVFKLTAKPRKGNIVKRSDGGSFVLVDEFKETDIENGRIYYESVLKEPSKDEFAFVLSDGGTIPNLSKEYIARITLLAADIMPPYKRHAGDCLVHMNETEASISLNFIDYVDDHSPSSDIVIQIQQGKKVDMNYVKSEDIVSLVGYKKVPVANFTQQQLFHNKVLLLNRDSEVGKHSKSLQIGFVVSDRDNNTTPLQSCTIVILPIDNKAPLIFINDTFSVLEGGAVCINWPKVALSDVDTTIESLSIALSSKPKHGVMVYKGRNISEDVSIRYVELKQNCLWYYHSGSETLQDVFSIVASDGINTRNGDVTISITPVNDERPEFVREFASIKVMENSSVVIDTELLAAVDKDSDSSIFKYYVISKPTKGHLDVIGAKVMNFSQTQLSNDLLIYIHNKEEIGPYLQHDNFTIMVCDDIRALKDCYSFIIIKVEIVPVNSIPPILYPKGKIIVEEGKSSFIDDKIIMCGDKDTVKDEISVRVISFPKIGFLENTSPSEGSEKSNAGKRISEFKCSDLRKQSIFYVQSNHTGFEPKSDMIQLVAFDGRFNSTLIELHVDIKPVNDEKPIVKQIKIAKVQEGGWKLIDKRYVSIKDKDIPKDILKYYVIKQPEHGQIFYKCNGAGSPRLQKLNHLQILDYKKCALIYIHDDSENLADAFYIEATDGKMTSQSRVDIEVIPVNDQWPKILNNIVMTVRFGGIKNITSSYLIAQDLDTRDQFLSYRITKLPKYGSFRLNVQGNPVKLAVNDTFTQDDVNTRRISYINHIMPVQGLTDTFKFSLSDGVHVIKNQTFTMRIRLSCRKKFKVKTRNVTVDGPRIFISSSNIKVERKRKKASNDQIVLHIVKQPLHGVLALTSNSKDVMATAISLSDLVEKRLTYRPYEYPLSKNDSFKFFATDGKCMQRGRLHFIAKSLNATVKTMKKISTLHVTERGQTMITPLEIRALDTFNPKKVVYTIRKLPKNGVIVRDGQEINNFTQTEVNELRIAYRLLKDKANVDQAFIEVFVKDYYGLGLSTKQEAFPFTINIKIPSISNVHVITNQGVTSLESMRRHGKGAVITNRNLLSYNCSSKLDPSLRYTVIEPPVHGELIFKDSRHQATNFTQEDINKERIVYMLTDYSHKEFSDSLLLDIEAKDCHKQTDVKFNINWSIVSLSDDVTVDCRNGQTEIFVNLTRLGYLSQGSVVELYVKSLTDSSQSLPPTRIWFYPGERTKSWKIADEALEYETVEVNIDKEFNTLLGRNKVQFEISNLQDACLTMKKTDEGDSTKVKATTSVKPGKTTPKQDLTKHTEAGIKHCGKGWVNFGTTCYTLIKRKINWRKATKFCKKRNSSLYTPVSTAEEQTVRHLSGRSPIWIGIRINKRGRLKWNIPASYRSFLQRLLVIKAQGFSKNTCVYLDAERNLIAAGCKQKLAFAICKKSI
ncbi:FRAS1-related extracellular matrix protein 2-like isoform X2 [Rhopilema esculentum]|uniref:FRAS1-related extracellular matrix protein 2-like isoform X2 n=1 Tax=Rhopilema esculentum TaxID=499914 RepID=UPI0031D39605